MKNPDGTYSIGQTFDNDFCFVVIYECFDNWFCTLLLVFFKRGLLYVMLICLSPPLNAVYMTYRYIILTIYLGGFRFSII